MDRPASSDIELTPEYVQTHWPEVAERARAGERLRVPAAGVAIVPIEQEEDAMRAWGRRELLGFLADDPDLAEEIHRIGTVEREGDDLREGSRPVRGKRA